MISDLDFSKQKGYNKCITAALLADYANPEIGFFWRETLSAFVH